MSISSLCVNTLPEKPDCPDHLDYTIQFPVPKSEVSIVQFFSLYCKPASLSQG